MDGREGFHEGDRGQDDFVGLPKPNSIMAPKGELAKNGKVFNTEAQGGQERQAIYEETLESLPVHQFSPEDIRKIAENARRVVKAENQNKE